MNNGVTPTAPTYVQGTYPQVEPMQTNQTQNDQTRTNEIDFYVQQTLRVIAEEKRFLDERTERVNRALKALKNGVSTLNGTPQAQPRAVQTQVEKREEGPSLLDIAMRIVGTAGVLYLGYKLYTFKVEIPVIEVRILEGGLQVDARVREVFSF